MSARVGLRRPGIWTLTVALVSGLVLGCASHLTRPGDVVLDAPEVELPVRWFGERDFITTAVHVGEAGPFNFLLDTGAAGVFVSPEVAVRSTGEAGFLFGAMKAKDVAGTPLASVGHVRFDSMRTGGVEFRDLDAFVMDLSNLSARRGTRIDGILGYPVFSGGLLDIDYPAGKVRFGTTALGPVDEVEVFPLAERHAPVLLLRHEHREFRVDIDTADSLPLHLGDAVPEDLIAAGPVAAPDRRGPAGKITGESYARLRGTLRWGPVALVDPVVGIGHGATIGSPLLCRYRVLLDLANGRYSILDGPRTVTFAPITGTGAYLLEEEDCWVVETVVRESPAARAGLRERDRVRSVNGLRLDRGNASKIWELMETRGLVLQFRVEREGREMELEVPVEDLIP